MLRVFFLFSLLFAVGACTPMLGDTCETNVQCDPQSGATCDTTIPGGYCIVPSCQPGTCPDGGVCVFFDEFSSFCMEYCEADDTCRADLICRPLQDNSIEEFTGGSGQTRGDGGFCYLPLP